MISTGLVLFNLLLLLGIFCAAGIAALVIGRRMDTTWATPLMWMAVIAGWLMGTYLLELNTPGLEGKLFWGYLQYISKVFIPVAYLMFTLAYTESRWYRRSILALTSIVPVLSLIFLWFDVNDLMYTTVALVPSSIGPNVNADYGWWFWVFIAHTYTLLGVGAIVLIRAYLSARQGLTRIQIALLAVCSFFPGLSNIFTLIDVVEIDLFPLFIGLMALFIAVGLLRLRLFEIEPTRMAVVEKMDDGYISVDLENRIIDFNRAAFAILDKTRWQLRNSNLEGLNAFSPETLDILRRPDFVGRVEDTLTIGREKRRFALYVSVLPEPGKTPYGRLILMRDITLQSQLEQSQQDLIRAVIHDLRSPTGTTIGMLEVLEEELQEEAFDRTDALELLQTSNYILRNNIQLIEQSLELNRLENGDYNLDLQLVALEDLFDQVMELMRPASGQKKQLLEIHVEAGLPRVLIDRLSMRRVLQNLIDNAIKFTPREGKIVLSARRVELDGEPQVVISVADTGQGIARELQPLLFQKFTYGDLPQHGYGLGLAFCRSIVEAHGEQIWIEDSSKQGTTFAFSLPTGPTRIPI